MDVRPVAALLRRTPGAQQGGNSAGEPAALVVIAIGGGAEAEPAQQFTRVVAGIGPALR